MKSSSKIEAVLEQGMEVLAFYRKNPIIAASDLLNVKLAPIQQVVFEDMWFKNYSISVCARGFGKTWLLGLLATLSALLYPGYRVGLIGPVFRQSKMIFHEVEKQYDKSPILREACEKKPTRGADTCYLQFKARGGNNGSFIEGIPLGDGCLTYCNYSTFFDRFDNIGSAHNREIITNHYIDRKDIVWGNGEFRESDRSLCNGVKNTIKIKTKKGFESEGTPNHRFKIFRDGEVQWCRFDEMIIGDKILIDRSYRWHNGNSGITEEQAYSLGFLIGDGCWTDKRRCLSFATLDKELLPILKEGIGYEIYEAPDNVHYIAYSIEDKVTQNMIREKWMNFWDMPSTYAIDKKLPKKILSASRNNMSACIQGLYDSDGNIQVSTSKGGVGITIGFTNTSKELIDQLHYILLHYGIVAIKITRNRNKNWNTIYELLITGSDVKIFYEEIGFRLKRKMDILEAAVKNKNRWVDTSHIPGIRKNMIKISSDNRIVKGKGTLESRYVKPYTLKRVKNITAHMVDCFLKTYGHLDNEEINKIKELANPNIFYDEIVEISEGNECTYDIHVPEGNEYCANGFFSHNSKIRGSRYYLICVDELAQVPDKVLDMVLRPMAATAQDPMENVLRIERKKKLIEAGLAVESDFEERANKMVMTSSGYYKFNHMWRRMKDYWRRMREEGEKSQYVVHQIPYTFLPEGFQDKNNIEEAKRIMSNHEYSMEYEAAMISDSEGFFKASLLEECTSNSNVRIEMSGDKNAQYIMGVDPNQGGSASCGIVIAKLGDVNGVVRVIEAKSKTTQDLVRQVQDLCDKYNIIRIYMDKGGGGKALLDLLEEGYGDKEPILDRTNDDNKFKAGRHILEMVNFTTSWISDANFSTLSLLETNKLRFPEAPTLSSIDADYKIYESIRTLKSQMLNIIVTSTAGGALHFDTPKKGQNKDLYSAIILVGYGIKSLDKESNISQESQIYNSGGFIRNLDSGSSWDAITGIKKANRPLSSPGAVLKRRVK